MPGKSSDDHPDDVRLPLGDFAQLVGLAASSNHPDATAVLRRLARRYRGTDERAARELVGVLRAGPTRGAAAGVAEPVDVDSRLPLLRREDPVVLHSAPLFAADHQGALTQIVREHQGSQLLYDSGLTPTRTALFVGPPGAGKTVTARWIAQCLGLPLLTLNLASVMSSLLGRTGSNIHRVLEHARESRCVLLLDEVDAVAKRRDDVGEVGELKRLVTVLLQEIDRWPEGSLLIAATNHGDLLDPAIWRRFEVTLNFPLPDEAVRTQALRRLLLDDPIDPEVVAALAVVTAGQSLSTLESDVMTARRRAALNPVSLEETLLELQKERIGRLPSTDRIALSRRVLRSGALSQRQVSRLTGVSRDTLRKPAEKEVTDA